MARLKASTPTLSDNGIQLTRNDGLGLTLFALLKCFTDTQYRLQPGIERGLETQRNVRIAFVVD